MPARPRICAVSYLNTVPLVWGLLQEQDRCRYDLRFALPAACAGALALGACDVGLVPVATLPELDAEPLPSVGIACRGAVRSILLVSKVPPDRIATLATDAGSRTSVNLARIVLEQRYGVRPTLTSKAPDLPTMLAVADAALLIGDPALRLEPAALPFHVLDLGEEWWALTGLPMVFATWAVRRQSRLAAGPLDDALRASYAHGWRCLDEIIRRESESRRFPEPLVRDYLRHRIRFELGPEERQGLQRFLDELARLPHLTPRGAVPGTAFVASTLEGTVTP